MIAFIVHQYYRLQDNLADVLLTVAQSYQNSVAREHRDWCYESRKQRDQSIKSLLNTFDNSVFSALADIRNVVTNETITDTEKVAQIEKLVADPDEAIEKSEELKSSLEQAKEEGNYFEILKNRSLRLQNRISPIVKSLDFQAEPGAYILMEAITFFKEKDGNISKNAPLDFLEDEQRTAVNAEGLFRISLYKVFLFRGTRTKRVKSYHFIRNYFKYNEKHICDISPLRIFLLGNNVIEDTIPAPLSNSFHHFCKPVKSWKFFTQLIHPIRS